MEYSWRRFQLTLGPKYGVRWLPTFVHGDGPPDPSQPMAQYRRNARKLTPAQHPFDLGPMWTYETMYVETPRFMAQLVSDLLGAGGRIRLRRFAAPADIAALDEALVFNCTGIGARELFGDNELTPIRGQLAVLPPQAEVRYAFTGESGYMFPRADGILLGGTFERGEWSTVPEPAAVAGIIQSHRRVFESFRCGA
jgi:glycine/D-amino acid oxidase-like deaminating enzyme